MKPATSALINFLANINSAQEVVVVDLYTFVLNNSLTVRYADYPLPSISIPAANFPGSPFNYNGGVGAQTFISGPKFGRSKVSTKIGIEPSELNIEMYVGTSDLIGDLSWQGFALTGGFDGGKVELDRFFMPRGGDGFTGNLDTSLGAVVWFFGKVADVDIQRSMVNIKVKSLINVLQQQQMPRRLFQAGCTHVFGDAMCGYDRVGGKNALGTSTGIGQVTVTALSGSGQTQLTVSPVSNNQHYTLGTCKGASGQNAGISRGILDFTASSTTIYFSRPFIYPVNVGDTFNLLPGCDHTINTCNTTYLNLLRYGGFDYIPPPELAI